MQKELDAENLPVGVRILGVNAPGLESGNSGICNGRDIPWLQDTVADSVWTHWQVTWRDVVILNPVNEVVDVYNLTTRDLADSTHYAELKDLIRSAANAAASP
jgi:hypothetical protein